MKFKKRQKQNGPICTETKPLGTYLHLCKDMIIINLTSEGIPFPNAQVLDKNNKVIGVVEEVLGPQTDTYAAIKVQNPDIIKKLVKDNYFSCYSNKFIPRSRFLPRSEAELKKEKEDRKKRMEMKKSGMGENKRKQGGDFGKNKKQFSRDENNEKKGPRDNFKKDKKFKLDKGKNGKDENAKRRKF